MHLSWHIAIYKAGKTMNVKLFNTLFNEVLPEVPGASQDIALNAIRNAAIEFCDRSMCWTYTQDPISAVANQPNYAFEPDNGADVAGVIQAWFNGLLITFKTAQQLEQDQGSSDGVLVSGFPWSEATGTPLAFTIERADEFILVPMPDTSITDAIKMKLALKPSRTASGMEKWVMDKHYMAIASGAKAKLMESPGKPWSNSALSKYHKDAFDQAISDASIPNALTQKLPEIVTAPSPI